MDEEEAYKLLLEDGDWCLYDFLLFLDSHKLNPSEKSVALETYYKLKIN